ncbi:fumarylacetoacetate hydrolase [Rhodococcus qingshengii]|uniref:fumarylacetoacetate hydrolase family protein n=1 Tax=Rhodococcus qingshengii TaxID=334542 RepID=UPI0007E58388|nr:fumarylacetoacetate hydrolase family protein [Rhodococcus qingshengii]BCF83291.1 fumarylacetoacetate hydrolase [Rhodococcus qingshengii]
MRIVNVSGRAGIVTDSGVMDVYALTNGAFGPCVASCLEDWPNFRSVVDSTERTSESVPYDERDLGAPVPEPRQIFAIGLNYADHARETGTPAPEHPVVFTKFQSSLTGPVSSVALTSDTIDYEAELVVVVGVLARSIEPRDAWNHVAGLMVGQDLSDRRIQTRGGAGAQWSLGKSLPGYSPCGPALVTVDELADRDNLSIRCSIGSEVLQDSSTREMIFTVPELISRLSHHLPLLPGDLIFTGTPAGVGIGRTPPRYLRAGETLVTEIAELGSLKTTFTEHV